MKKQNKRCVYTFDFKRQMTLCSSVLKAVGMSKFSEDKEDISSSLIKSLFTYFQSVMFHDTID